MIDVIGMVGVTGELSTQMELSMQMPAVLPSSPTFATGSDWLGKNGSWGNENVTKGDAGLAAAAAANATNPYVLVPLTAFYALIFATGVVGNFSTCVVIAYNKFMHTATNYYLFSLAVSDLLLLFAGLPKETYELWFSSHYDLGGTFCFLQGFASESSANATVLTITAFTVERYVAICHPFLSHTVSKLSRAVKHIAFIWMLALCLALPQAIQFEVKSFEDGSSTCTVTEEFMGHGFELSSFIFFFVPMAIISVLYILIGFRLRASRLMKSNSIQYSRPQDGQSTMRNQRRVIRMLVAVVVAFIICWAPFHAQRLLVVYASTDERRESTRTLYILLTHISGVFYYTSATINPLLYNIMSNRFRRAFKMTFGLLCGCCLSASKRNEYTSAYSSCYRPTIHHHQSSVRSNESQKDEIPLYATVRPCGLPKSHPLPNERNLSTSPAISLSPPAKPVKRDRSPIKIIKDQLQQLTQPKYQRTSDQNLFDSEFAAESETEIDTLGEELEGHKREEFQKVD